MTADPTILITIEPNEDAITHIRSEYPESEIRIGPFVRNTEEVLSRELMIGVEILFCEVPPANFREFDCLKWIQLTSHGYAQIFGLPLLEREIRVSNGLGTFDIPIAEWNIMMMLFWHRNMLEMLQYQKDCIWDRAARFQTELRGAVVGFYGYGGIGCVNQSGSGSDHQRGSDDPLYARGLDSRSVIGCALRVPPAAGAPAVVHV